MALLILLITLHDCSVQATYTTKLTQHGWLLGCGEHDGGVGGDKWDDTDGFTTLNPCCPWITWNNRRIVRLFVYLSSATAMFTPWQNSGMGVMG